MRQAIERSHGFGAGSVEAFIFTPVLREANGQIFDGIRVHYTLEAGAAGTRYMKATLIFQNGELQTIADFETIRAAEPVVVSIPDLPVGYQRAASNQEFAFRFQQSNQGAVNRTRVFVIDLKNPDEEKFLIETQIYRGYGSFVSGVDVSEEGIVSYYIQRTTGSGGGAATQTFVAFSTLSSLPSTVAT